MCLLFNDAANVWLRLTAVIDESTSMGHRWNDTDSGNPKYSEKNWFIPTHIIHDKTHMDWSVVIEEEILGKVLGRMKKVQRGCLLVLWKFLVNNGHRTQCFVCDWRQNHLHLVLKNTKAVSCRFCAALYTWKKEHVWSSVAYRLVCWKMVTFQQRS
jgi:hypothetical protein